MFFICTGFGERLLSWMPARAGWLAIVACVAMYISVVSARVRTVEMA